MGLPKVRYKWLNNNNKMPRPFSIREPYSPGKRPFQSIILDGLLGIPPALAPFSFPISRKWKTKVNMPQGFKELGWEFYSHRGEE